MIKLVIVDFDGTLCLTEPIYYSIKNRITGTMGFPPMSRDLHRKSWGEPLCESITKLFPGIDFDVFLERMSRETSRLAASNAIDIIVPENLETLDRINALGKKIALLTARRLSDVAHLITDQHPLNLRMERFYHKDNLKYIKPDPRVFNKPLADFHVRPVEAVYVGDALNDAIAAKSAGLHFIAVLEQGTATKEDFATVPVDFFSNKFSDILEYIRESPASGD